MKPNYESCPCTLNTTRICAADAVGAAIEVSKIGFTNMKPNAVILIDENGIFDGIAATPLVHFPINAAILFTDCNNLRKETLNEIKRLSPKGYEGIHVILVGNISKNVSLELNRHGFKTQHIESRNYYETACIIPKVRKDFKNILIISGEDYSEGIAAAYWSAHHGDPILYTKKNSIPCCTLEAIKKMKGINVYIIGSTKTVSKAIEGYLSKLDNVKRLVRIDGENPYDIAVNFAKYKDPKTDFGWGRHYKEGHAFTFGVLNNPMEIIAGVLFAHMGKHTPLLLTKKDKIPGEVKSYIKLVKPMIPKDMPMPPFMHGFILGTARNISHEAQIMIEDSLSIDHEMMEMEHMGEMMQHHMEKEHHNMHDSDHMHMMHHMSHQHHMMEMDDDMMEEMKHEMMNHKEMEMKQHEVTDMDDEDHMQMMHHMHQHMIEEHEKAPCHCEGEVHKDHEFKRLDLNYRTVSINKLLSE